MDAVVVPYSEALRHKIHNQYRTRRNERQPGSFHESAGRSDHGVAGKQFGSRENIGRCESHCSAVLHIST